MTQSEIIEKALKQKRRACAPQMKFPLIYDNERDAIFDSTGEYIAELKGGCIADMLYLIEAANEKWKNNPENQD